jgi:hypothetical protein
MIERRDSIALQGKPLGGAADPVLWIPASASLMHSNPHPENPPATDKAAGRSCCGRRAARDTVPIGAGLFQGAWNKQVSGINRGICDEPIRRPPTD